MIRSTKDAVGRECKRCAGPMDVRIRFCDRCGKEIERMPGPWWFRKEIEDPCPWQENARRLLEE